MAEEYDYYDASLTFGIHTTRGDAPSTLFMYGDLHTDFVVKIRAALREKNDTITSQLPVYGGQPVYGITKIWPMGAMRTVDQDYNLEITRQRFELGITIPLSAWQAGEQIVLGIERHIEKAAKDALAAAGMPKLVIPGDRHQIGDTFIDIMCELGPATNQGPLPS